MKKILFAFVFLLITTFIITSAGHLYAEEGTLVLDYPDIKDGNFSEAVTDLPETGNLPVNWRMSPDIFTEKYKNEKVNVTGMDKLNMSGSGNFSTGEFMKMVEAMKGKKVTIVDLRQESHGFINNMCVRWHSDGNAINKGKITAKIIQDEKDLIDGVKKEKKIIVKKVFYNESPQRVMEIPVNVVSAQTEEELATKNGFSYLRIAVPDFQRPSDRDVDMFIDFYHTLMEEDWLHFHCHAGKGRTTTFMVMYDMMRNYDKVSLEDIAYRQLIMGGMDLLADSKWENDKARTKFVRDFYQYCKECGPEFNVYWSEWVEKQNKQ